MKHSIFKILNNASLLFFIFLYTFYVNGQTISSFSPTTGPIGTIVTITGTGFDNTLTNNIVFFGATAATVSAASATSLTATVPTGANYQYITATNIITNLTAYSDKPFIVTTICNSATTFAPAISVQGGSHNVEIYDMDGDGKADLIIPDYFNNYFTVTRNTSTPGSISFAAKVTFPWAAGGQPNEVSIGDFDGDGKPDVALGGNGGGAFVSVYRNTSTIGSISFAPRADFTASIGQGNGNKIIDIDGDGKPDLISVHWSGNCVWVLRNTSTGPGIISFAAGVSFSTTTQPHKIDVGDLDGDNKPDLVITAFTSNTMSVFRNTSTAGTISFATRQDFSPGTVPYFVHIADLDGDDRSDIAIVNRDVATLTVYRNTSSPGAITLAARQDFATPAGTFTHYGLGVGDLDGDAKPDIAVGNYTLNNTSVFRNTSIVGTISFAPRVDLAAGVSYDVGIADFDGDYRPDIAVTNSGSTVSILANLCILLPIELISFTAENEYNKILLKWSTASEKNNNYFSIEKSYNGIDFFKIGEISGAGYSNIITHYTFIDETPIYGLNYYRLKQTDFDGQFSYSETEVVPYLNENLSISCYPVPFKNEIYLNGTEENGIAIFYDMRGEEIKRQTTTTRVTKITTEDIPTGSYLIRYVSQFNSFTIAVSKL